MTVYYLIGNNFWREPYGEHIYYLPDRETKPIFTECSVPHMAAGGFLTPQEALDSKWADLFRDANAEWFLPFLRRMADGERVGLEEIQSRHQTVRGTPLLRVEDPRDLK